MAIGISYKDFWGMNPRIVKQHGEAEKIRTKKRIEEENYIAYLNGAYVMKALYASVGNMFSSKNAKQIEYPKEPFSLGLSKKESLSEKELTKQREQFLAQLMTMQTNFELSKKEKEV